MITIDARAEDTVTHIVYDPDTGRILGTLRHDRHLAEGHEDHGEDGGCRCAQDRTGLDAFVRDGAPGKSLPQLVDAPGVLRSPLSALRVDPRRRRLVALPHLVVDAERSVLEGDGEDTVTIEIRAVDEQGAVVEDFTGEVHVQTGRGKLSARGGTVRLEAGRATITLTSVAETVDAVPLVVTAPEGTAATARATLRFE